MIAPLIGLFAGAAHAVSGPDHLAAVAPLVAKRDSQARHAGFKWGVGHATAVFILGGAALFFRDLLPLETLSSVSERLVGAVLVGMGVWGLLRVFRNRLHSHEHAHEGIRHNHPHIHLSAPNAVDQGRRHRHGHGAFWIGALHGLAGGAHLALVMAALALPTVAASLGYLFFYGLGSLLAMAGVSEALSRWARRLGARPDDRAFNRLSAACSACAFTVGVIWLAP